MNMKIYFLIASAACLALFAAPFAAADTAGLKRCANIGSPLDRLECYDALARSVDALPPTPPRPAKVAAPPPVTRPVTRPAAAPTAPRPTAPAPATVADARPEPEDFGFEGKRFEENPEKQTARYDGEFLGWSGQTLFKLDNGQVWRQSQNGRVSYRRDRPLITIKKGAFGSYRLSVEGLNRTIRVKRVK